MDTALPIAQSAGVHVAQPTITVNPAILQQIESKIDLMYNALANARNGQSISNTTSEILEEYLSNIQDHIHQLTR